MTVIQGVLDKNASILSIDGVFTATRSGPDFHVDVPGMDVSRAFVLGTTTFDDNGVPPQPVTIVRPRHRSTKLIFIAPPTYGLSFRVDGPADLDVRRSARTKKKKRSKKKAAAGK